MKAKKPGATTPAARKATRSRGTAKTAAGIPIRVRPEDLEKLEDLAESANAPLWAAVNAAVEAGCWMIRIADVANKVERRGPEHYLWACINREPADYSATVRLAEDDRGAFQEAKEDAKQIGRTMADWCGTLVHVGLKAIESDAAVAEMMNYDKREIFVRAAAFTCNRKGGEQ